MTIKSPIKAIRAFCLQCLGGSAADVKTCTVEHCALWHFRHGKNPYRKPPTEKQREAGRKNARRMLAIRESNDSESN